jgi:two-component system, NtrC family, sensor histidine kinase KinB
LGIPGGDMSLRSKLTMGLGFLFLIIFALAIYSSYDIQQLSKDADRILRDNYDSLVYCKNMFLALDDMRTSVESRFIGPRPDKLSGLDTHTFEVSRSTFESSLSAEKSNITEIHERDYVKELTDDYAVFLKLCLRVNEAQGGGSFLANDFMRSYLSARQTIAKLDDLNMEAVERKSISASHDSRNMIVSMAAVGALCILLAFFYFWYFPFFVSKSLSYLSNRMKDLLKRIGIKIDTQTKDESFILLQSINLLENTLLEKKGG